MQVAKEENRRALAAVQSKTKTKTNTRNKMEKETGNEKDNVEIVKAIASLAYHTDSVYSFRFSKDGKYGISGGGDNISLLYQIDENKNPRLPPIKLLGHRDSVVSVDFNADSMLAATGSLDGTVKIWSTKDGSLLQTLQGPSEIEFVQWHNISKNVVLAGSPDSTSWIWNTNNGECLCVLGGHADAITCGGFTPNGKRVLTGSADGTVKLWDPNNGSCLHTFGGHGWHLAGAVVSLAFHPQEPLFATGADDGSICVTRLESRKVIARFQHGVGFNDNEIIPKGKNDEDDEEGDGDDNEAEESACSIETIGFCETHPWLASGASSGSIKVWDMMTQTCRSEFSHEDSVVKLQWLPSSTKILSCSADCTIRLWDARSGAALKVLIGHEKMILDFDVLFGSSSKSTVSSTTSGSRGAVKDGSDNDAKSSASMSAGDESSQDPKITARIVSAGDDPFQLLYLFST